MYWALLKQGVGRWRKRLWRAAVMRSGLLTFMLLTLVLAGLAFGWHEHRLGQFAQLKKEIGKRPIQYVTVRPGGQDAVRLERSQLLGGSGPEFLSATLLPGRAMNLLQITAYVPAKGEVSLLASPTLDEAAQLLTGTGIDATGAKSLTMGAAIEVPWASRIAGTPTPNEKNVMTVWRGMRLTLPAEAKNSYGTGVAAAGLFLKQASDSVSDNVMPDGGETQATFEPGNFDGHWPSRTEIRTTVSLSGRAINLKIVALNTGDTAEPIGIGWHPRFAILNGNRAQMRLRLPQAMRVEVKDRRTGQLSGRLLPVENTEYDFTGRTGAQLGALNLDDIFVHLRTGLLEDGPVAELRDPASGYGLRITAMTSTIKAIRVYAPLDGSFISIEPQFNYDDPFGREWPKDEDTGMVVLQPGQSTQWKIRLEIFPLSSGQPDSL
jgi:galactose mutarotase-like enzyme